MIFFLLLFIYFCSDTILVVDKSDSRRIRDIRGVSCSDRRYSCRDLDLIRHGKEPDVASSKIGHCVSVSVIPLNGMALHVLIVVDYLLAIWARLSIGRLILHSFVHEYLESTEIGRLQVRLHYACGDCAALKDVSKRWCNSKVFLVCDEQESDIAVITACEGDGGRRRDGNAQLETVQFDDVTDAVAASCALGWLGGTHVSG